MVERKKAKFLSEQEKADGWMQQFSSTIKFSVFPTNLHYLPEHLWTKLIPFYQENVKVGHKTRDKNIYYFVHNADTDSTSWELLMSKDRYDLDKDRIKQLVDYFDEKGIESWLTFSERISKINLLIDK